MTAVLTVKRPYGYGGDLCTKGTMEYVAFWMWDEIEQMWVYLGTSAVNVHDIPNIPHEGIQYAVTLPVKLPRDGCGKPTVVRIRAILSWVVPPPPNNPNYDPVWGNRLDILVQPKPRGVGKVFISAIGDISVTDINSNGYATGCGISSGILAKDSPFGGWITISGHILQPKVKYKVSYRKVGEPDWIDIVNEFYITISEWDGTSWKQHKHKQVAVNGYYGYKEDLANNVFVEDFVLARWYTGGLEDGLYEIKVTLEGGDVSNIVRVRLDNTPPKAEITITDVECKGKTMPADPCGTFVGGCTIKGKFTAKDEHFRVYTIVVEPADLAAGVHVSPYSESYPTIPTPDREWKLDTSKLIPCGYIVKLRVWDRTIVNSRHLGWKSSDSVGFCLKEG